MSEAVIQNFKMGILNGSDVTRPSLDNQYQVFISGVPTAITNYLTKEYGVDSKWPTRNVGMLCSEAVLPTSSFATAEVKDNFQGISEQYAHTRLYVDTNFTFYVDKDYKMIKFFEGWMDWISGTDQTVPNTNTRSYYRKFNYPKGSPTSDSKDDCGYKAVTLSISKFEKDFNSKTNRNYLQYDFINPFPKSMSSIPVKYGPADLLRVTVTFAYDRYVMVPTTRRKNTNTTSSTTSSINNANKSGAT